MKLRRNSFLVCMHDNSWNKWNVNLMDITAFKLKEFIRFRVNNQISLHRNTTPTETKLLADVKVNLFPQQKNKIITRPLGLH